MREKIKKTFSRKQPKIKFENNLEIPDFLGLKKCLKNRKDLDMTKYLNHSTIVSTISKNLQKLIIELEVADKMRRKGKKEKAHENNMKTIIWFHEIFGESFIIANYELRAILMGNSSTLSLESLFLSENQKRLINNFVFQCTTVGEYKNHTGQVWTKNSKDLEQSILVFN
jgi:hypothetical protein